MNKEFAREIIERSMNLERRLFATLERVRQNEPRETFVRHRRAVGYVVGFMGMEFLEEIYDEHPDLEPLEKREEESERGRARAERRRQGGS